MIRIQPLIILILFISFPLHADRTVTSATVDGALTTTVAPGTAINLTVNVTTTTTGGGASDNWRSTGWLIAGSSGVFNCENHGNYNNAGSHSDSFTVTAPAVAGTYNLYLVAYRNNNCTAGASAQFILNNAVVVASSGSCAVIDTELNSPNLVFSDDFNDGNFNGWTENGLPGGGGCGWTITGGRLEEDSNSCHGFMQHDLSVDGVTTGTENNYALKVDVDPNASSNSNNAIGYIFGYEDDNNYYRIRWRDYSPNYSTQGTHKDFVLERVQGGTNTVLDSQNAVTLPASFSLIVTVTPASGIQVFIDCGAASASLSAPLESPPVRLFGLYTDDNDSGIFYDNAEVYIGTVLTPQVEYRMDEAAWSGAAGDVIDAQGNIDGNPFNGLTTDNSNPAIAGDPGTCYYGDFDGTDDYIGVPGLSSPGVLTAMAWVNPSSYAAWSTIMMQSNANWTQGWGLARYNTGTSIGFYVQNYGTFNVQANVPLNQWTHVAGVYDGNTINIYINGVLANSRVIGFRSTATTEPLLIGDSNWLGRGAGNDLWSGYIDEVRVYNQALNASQINTAYNETRSCPSTSCNATYRDEFTSASFGNNDGDTNFSADWDEFEGTSLTVPEASPDPTSGHVQVSGGELLLQNYSPESANAPGVERQLDLSAYTTATFSFDFRTFGGVDADDSILIQASGNGGTSWTLLENITGIANTSGSKSYDLTPFISNNTRIRLRFNTTINTGACCYGGAGETLAIDNINIDATGSCPTVDHYAISHGGVGITCEAEAVTVTAHDASHVAVIPTSSTTVTLTTSIANDGWALRTGNGTFTPPDQYTFDGVESSVEFWLTKTTATTAPHMDIDVTDGTASDPDDGGVEDAVLEFRETAFRFYADGVNNAIGPQIAGKWSDDTSGIQALTLRAVQTNTDTMACEARVTGPLTVPMAFECIDPTSCKTNNGVTLIDSVIGGAGDTLNDNPQGGPIVYSNVNLTFDATGTASWIMKYDDAGQIRLHADLTLPASPPDPADTLSGTSNTFTTSPAGICVSTSDANAACNPANASCSAFKKAGESFNLDIRAVAWQTAGENNTDFCAGNATTPNFQFTNLALGHNLLAPVGAPGSIGVNLFDMIAADDGDHNISNQTVSEVGAFSFFTPDLSYFGETILSSTSANIGRFYPDHFVLTDTQLTNRSDLGCASAFTYMDENFQTSFDLEARNVGGVVTQNYTTASGFAKLNTEAELNFGAVDLTAPTDLTARLTVSTPDVINFIAGVADADTGLTDTLTDDLMLNRLTVAPYTDGAYALRVGVAPQDDDGVILNSYDLDVNGGGNDHAEIGSTLIYYGRQIVSNAHGSELQPLTIGLKTQRFDGVSFSFVTNDLDNCSAYNVTDINLAAATYTAPLTDTDLGLTGAGLFAAGIASFSMHDDTVAADGPGVTGDVTYNMVVPAYLQYDWDADLVFTDDPSAKATFGIFNGNSKQIYFRQIYQ